MSYRPDNPIAMIGESQSNALLNVFGPLKLMLVNGFTTVRDVATGPQWGFLTVDMKRGIDQGKIVGPRMIVAPHCITSVGGHGDMTGMLAYEIYSNLQPYAVADGPDEVQKTVREEIKGGADWIKCAGTGGFMSPTSDPGVPTYTQEEMDILVKTAHDQGIPVCVHAYGDEGIRRAVIAGVDSIEHGDMASLDTLNMMERNGTYIIPTQYTFVDPLTNLDNSAYWATQPPWEYQKYAKYASAIRESEKNLAKSNVKIAFGTDVGSFPWEDGWKEFPTMVKNGISPLRALKAATSVAAELLRRPDLGVLAVGKTADIIAMPGDPFQDINATGKVDFVMKEGKIYKMDLKFAGFILLILLVSAGSSQEGYLLPSPAGLQTSGFQIGNESDWLGYPWYSSNISFNYGFNTSPEMSQAFSFFSEYYIDTGAPIVGGIISTPVRYEISQQMPSTVYLAGGQQLPYSQYTTTAIPRGNELWIQGASGWSQYVVSPVGTWLQLVAYSPEGGNAGFYEIVQTASSSVKYRTYQLYPGYNQMDFYVDQAGRHILLFVVNNRPSNAVIVDALYQSPPSTEVVLPEPGIVTSPGYTPAPPSEPRPQPVPTTGDTPVTVTYPSMRNIDVNVDGQYVGSGIGSLGFRVQGGMNHEITVWDGSWYYNRNLYFESGAPKIIYVEAV